MNNEHYSAKDPLTWLEKRDGDPRNPKGVHPACQRCGAPADFLLADRRALCVACWRCTEPK